MIAELTSFAARLRERISSGSSRREEARSEADFKWNLLTSAATDQEFNSLALELFALQFANNAAYRRLCEARGAKPASVEHWSRIPAVPTVAFKELELTCLPPAERTAVFHSSGTTEQRLSRHFHSAESLSLYEASLWAWFQQHVLPSPGLKATLSPSDGERAGVRGCREQASSDLHLAILTPPPTAAPNSSLVHMCGVIQRESSSRRGDEADRPELALASASSRRRLQTDESAFLGGTDATGAWTLDFERAKETIQAAITTSVPLVLLGTAFNFVHLLDWLAERDLRFELPPGSVVMETGGYKGRSRELLKAELHALITRRLGVPLSQIVCEYGMSELSSQAYDGMAGVETRNPKLETRNFSFPPWARVQIISPETGREVADGETGLVRIFDLANVFSVLAVQTEDLAIRRGDGFELLGRAAAAEPRGCSLMSPLVVPPLGSPFAAPPEGGTTNPVPLKS